MNKELTPLEALREITDFLDVCFGYKNSCNATRYNASDLYLKPFVEQVENSLKALEIIKNKKVDMAILLGSYDLYSYNSGFGYLPQEDELTQEEYDLLKEVLL